MNRRRNKVPGEGKLNKNSYMESAAGITALLFFPIVSFFLLEFYSHNPFEEVRPWAQFFNVLLFELMAWLLFFLTGRVRMAVRIELAAAMLFGIANAYVMRFRTNPIVPWDFFSIKTAANVASNYDFMPDARMVTVSLIFLGCIAAAQLLSYKINHLVFWKRLIPAGIAAAALVLFAGRLQDVSFQVNHKLYPYLFTPVYMTDVNGIAVTFVMNLAYISVEKPEGYDAEEMQPVLDSYRKESSAKETAAELPNIIVVMNESFSDLGVLGSFTANKDYMPYLHSLQEGAENTVTGILNVSVCGGNTANTEFEFLTGHTMAFLPQGSIPYQQYITGDIPALPRYLASLGYQTVATHPYYANGWQRDKVYPKLGFSDSVFINEYDKTSIVRKYVSDDACVDKIIQIYEEKEAGVPLFVFNVTMQNHGGYSDSFDNFIPDITVEGVEEFSLEQYLSLVRLSDASLEKLISYFEHVDEKTVVVFFGDHQPNDAVASGIMALSGISIRKLSEEKLKLRYEVPYVIWANFDIPEKSGVETSANFLGAEVLAAAKVPTDAYQNYLLELKQEYPVISAMRVRRQDGSDSNAMKEKEYLREYQSLQYYQLFDWEEPARGN